MFCWVHAGDHRLGNSAHVCIIYRWTSGNYCPSIQFHILPMSGSIQFKQTSCDLMGNKTETQDRMLFICLHQVGSIMHIRNPLIRVTSGSLFVQFSSCINVFGDPFQRIRCTFMCSFCESCFCPILSGLDNCVSKLVPNFLGFSCTLVSKVYPFFCDLHEGKRGLVNI